MSSKNECTELSTVNFIKFLIQNQFWFYNVNNLMAWLPQLMPSEINTSADAGIYKIPIFFFLQWYKKMFTVIYLKIWWQQLVIWWLQICIYWLCLCMPLSSISDHQINKWCHKIMTVQLSRSKIVNQLITGFIKLFFGCFAFIIYKLSTSLICISFLQLLSEILIWQGLMSWRDVPINKL